MWPYFHTLNGRTGKVVSSHAEGCKVARSNPAELHRFFLCTRRSGLLLVRVGDATSQLDLPSLTLLSVTGCGRLQPEVSHWATSVISASS